MASWQRKKISKGQTIADRFKKTRLEQDLSLSDVYQATKIQIKYLELLEDGDYQSLPGEIYIRTWIKIYSEFLNLPKHELLADYKLEKIVRAKASQQEKFNQQLSSSFFLKKRLMKILSPHFLKRVAIIIVLLVFLSYLALEINNTISPPFINITDPVNNIKTIDSSINIVGQTEPEVQLMINNELVLLDKHGYFIENINLSPGLNKLQISAKKKHSKIQIIELDILREEAE